MADLDVGPFRAAMLRYGGLVMQRTALPAGDIAARDQMDATIEDAYIDAAIAGWQFIEHIRAGAKAD